MVSSSVMPAIQDRIVRMMKRKKISVSELARRTGRKREDVRRSLRSQHVWRLDRLRDYARALGVPASEIFEAEDFTNLAGHCRWDDRLSTPEIRRARLEGPDRYREVARILEEVPMDEYWCDLDFRLLNRHYPEIRPHLGRSRFLWDAILPLLAEAAE